MTSSALWLLAPLLVLLSKSSVLGGDELSASDSQNDSDFSTGYRLLTFNPSDIFSDHRQQSAAVSDHSMTDRSDAPGSRTLSQYSVASNIGQNIKSNPFDWSSPSTSDYNMFPQTRFDLVLPILTKMFLELLHRMRYPTCIHMSRLLYIFRGNVTPGNVGSSMRPLLPRVEKTPINAVASTLPPARPNGLPPIGRLLLRCDDVSAAELLATADDPADAKSSEPKNKPVHPDDQKPVHPDDQKPVHPDDQKPVHPDDQKPVHPDDPQIVHHHVTKMATRFTKLRIAEELLAGNCLSDDSMTDSSERQDTFPTMSNDFNCFYSPNEGIQARCDSGEFSSLRYVSSNERIVCRSPELPASSIGENSLKNSIHREMLLMSCDTQSTTAQLSTNQLQREGARLAQNDDEATSTPLQGLSSNPSYLCRTFRPVARKLPPVVPDSATSLFVFEQDLMKICLENRIALLGAFLTSAALKNIANGDVRGFTLLKDSLILKRLAIYPHLETEAEDFKSAMAAILLDIQKHPGQYNPDQAIRQCRIIFDLVQERLLERQTHIKTIVKDALVSCVRQSAEQVRRLTKHDDVATDAFLSEKAIPFAMIWEVLDKQVFALKQRMKTFLNQTESDIRLFKSDGVENQKLILHADYLKRFDTSCQTLLREVSKVIEGFRKLSKRSDLQLSSIDKIVLPLLTWESFTKDAASDAIARSTEIAKNDAISNAMARSLEIAKKSLSDFVKRQAFAVRAVADKYRHYRSNDCHALILRRKDFIASVFTTMMLNNIIYVTGKWRLAIEKAIDFVLVQSGTELSRDLYNVIREPFRWWDEEAVRVSFREALSQSEHDRGEKSN